MRAKLVQNKLRFWHVKLGKIAQVILSSCKLHIFVISVVMNGALRHSVTVGESFVLLLTWRLTPNS